MDGSDITNSGKSRLGAGARCAVFGLSATSIGSLLAQFYGVCPMRWFTPFVFIPAMLVLLGIAIADRARGDGAIWRAVWIGVAGGLCGAVAYDLFRLPFVFAREWGIDGMVPPMDLFKAFPGFGAMILGRPVEQPTYSMVTRLVGWAYHFSNGATFGTMYVALIGDIDRRHWLWGVVYAMALELGMLLTPYPAVFGIPVDARFVVVTMSAHAVFGVGLGKAVRLLANESGRAWGERG